MTISTTTKSLIDTLRANGDTEINFVPTMGALHAGHISLVEQARKADGMVVVSVFVNPTQFNDPNDLRNYPRTPEADLELLRGAGVDVVFMPSVEEIYPEPDTRQFDFGELDRVMEGATRPGHFNGVAQVVSRLFDLVRPTRAFFGQKDFQQVAVIRELVRQTNSPVEIVECPTVREQDGLALSSRNALLSPECRAVAPDIFRALAMAAQGLPIDQTIEQIERSGLLRVIYLERMGPQLCTAVQAGSVRLIDNIKVCK